MNDSQKCPHFGDGKPVSTEVWQEAVNVLHATLWITVLSSAKLWGALRRIPPKAFLLELVDGFLTHVTNTRQYIHLSENERGPALARRCAPLEHLRFLLVAWEPPTPTADIRDAALAVHIAEFGAPPAENWDDAERDVAMPLEATLIWPEGEWDENAFVTAQVDDKPQSEP